MLIGKCSDCARQNEGRGGFCEKCYHRDYFTPTQKFIEENIQFYPQFRKKQDGQTNVVGVSTQVVQHSPETIL